MKSFILIVTLLFSINLMAQEVSTDAVYEKISEDYTLNDDGSMSYHYYKKLKYNTHFSFNRLYGETFIVYNPAYQKLTVNVSKTTMADGKVVEGPFNSYNEVLPRFAANAPVYNGLREMVVTHPGLAVGSVVELDYTITTKAGFYSGLMVNTILTQSSPVNNHKITVKIPAGKTLHYKVLNLRTGPEIEEAKSSTTYSFNFNGIKESTHEAHQPADKLNLPRLYFSTLTFKEAIANVTSQDAYLYKIDEEMKAKVKELRDKNADETHFILDIQKIITDEINTYGVPPYYIGYAMRSPIETWKSNGGTPCEKTILMAALLREAGINANPVMVVPTKVYEEENGCLLLAERFLLQVNPKEKEQMYISAVKSSSQNMVYSLNEKTILLFEPTKNYVESVDEKFENKVITNGDIVFADDFTFAGKMETSLSERTNPYYSFQKDSTYAKKLITGGISSKDIIETEIINSAQFRTLAKMTVTAKKPVKNQGDYYFWDIPGNKSGAGSWNLTYLNSERNTPYEIPFVLDEQYSYSVTVPANVQLVNQVELTERKTDFGKMVLSTTQNGNNIIIKRMLVLNRTLITTEEYPAFKEMMDVWNEKNFRKLILKKGANP